MIATRQYRRRFTREAVEAVKQMTFSEKVHMIAGHCKLTDSMGGGSYNSVPYYFGGCKRLGIPELAFCDGPRGVVSGHSTCFPVAMACGATFDRDLEREVGRAIGREVLGNGGNYFGGVCMNVPYNPGAGRSQESFGEDSYHMGEMARSLMEGVQDENVIACAKHFAFNSMERSRFKVSVTADARTEQEVYFPHFKKVIDAGCASVMNAYNLYRGTKCGHNPYLLRKILKQDWGFDGFVISDFMWGVKSAEGGISGGCDVEMHVRQAYTEKNIRKALREKKITMRMINDACIRITRTTLAFEAARKESGKTYDETILACEDHIALARKVAEESITLLKNEDSFLPLTVKQRLVLVGDLSDTENIGDHGSSMVRPPYVRTLLDGVLKTQPTVAVSYVPTKDVKKRISEIAAADAVIITAGMSHSDEGEFIFVMGGDRKSLSLHKKDLEMIDVVSSVNANCGVVLMGGNVIMTHDWKDKVKAILFAYYPGMEGGTALADILYGKVNPSGKLPFAIAEYEHQYPAVKWDTKEQFYGYWHGYQKIDKDGGRYDYPFGFGLSYTTFEVGEAALVENTDEKAVFAVDVTNTGSCDGAEVVQCYVSFPESPVERPVRKLAGFEKVRLAAGETKRVCITVMKDELGWFDEDTESFVQDPGYEAWIGTDEQDVTGAGRF